MDDVHEQQELPGVQVGRHHPALDHAGGVDLRGKSLSPNARTTMRSRLPISTAASARMLPGNCRGVYRGGREDRHEHARRERDRAGLGGGEDARRCRRGRQPGASAPTRLELLRRSSCARKRLPRPGDAGRQRPRKIARRPAMKRGTMPAKNSSDGSTAAAPWTAIE